MGGRRSNSRTVAPAARPAPASTGSWTLGILVPAVVVAVVIVHRPALDARAVSFDDSQYLTGNLLVQRPGLASAGRFFREVPAPSTVSGYYQPLAMISLMLDYAVAGRPDNLRPFHRTSLALHAANTALVIVLLHELFGQPWVAALVGLLFGVHPLTVEPIPWVGERKTLLAAFFALGCLIAYVRYARRAGWKSYGACLGLYVLALLSKPTSTPLPVVMLVLDFWPLRRLGRRAVLEKLPFFALGVLSGAITVISQGRTASVEMPAGHSAGRTVLVVCHNTFFYLTKMIRPADLSSHYPFPEPLSLSDPMVLAGVVGTCLLVTGLVVSLRWTRALAAGGAVYAALIFPALGVVGFTTTIAADRFAYLPALGVLMVAAWFAGWCWRAGSWPRGSRLVRAGVVAGVLVLAAGEAAGTRTYLSTWSDTERHYRHMLSLAPQAVHLHDGLGVALFAEGRLDEAIRHYREAIRLDPHYPPAYSNLAEALIGRERFEEAVESCRRALALNPALAEPHNNLGYALQHLGRIDEAIAEYRETLRLRPEYALAHCNLGSALVARRQRDEAIAHFRRAIELDPRLWQAHANLGLSLVQQDKLDEAISHFTEAVRLRPSEAELHYFLGLALYQKGRLAEAVGPIETSLRLKPDFKDARECLDRLRAGLQAEPTGPGR